MATRSSLRAQVRPDLAPEPSRLSSTFRSAGFVELPIPERRPCGVYVLLLLGEVVWVGQTTAIENRLQLHACDGREFDEVLWRELSPDELNRYEGALLRALMPAASRGAPPYLGGDNEVLAAIGLPLHLDEAAAAASARATMLSRRTYTKPTWRTGGPRVQGPTFTASHRANQRRKALRLWAAVTEMFARKERA